MSRCYSKANGKECDCCYDKTQQNKAIEVCIWNEKQKTEVTFVLCGECLDNLHSTKNLYYKKTDANKAADNKKDMERLAVHFMDRYKDGNCKI